MSIFQHNCCKLGKGTKMIIFTKFYHLLLFQSLGNLIYFEATVSAYNVSEFLFAFVLYQGDEGLIWNKHGEDVNWCVVCEISEF